MTETASLHVTIPRTEEVYEKSGGLRGNMRTVFVVQVTCKAPGGSRTQQWQLKKRYGYFKRMEQLAARSAKALKAQGAGAHELAPVMPKRKLLGHTDPRYLSSFRDELQVFMGTVVELVRRESDQLGDELQKMLLKLELPAASDSSTWEQRGNVGRQAQVSMDGYLRKQGGWHTGKAATQRKWRQRWFILTGSSLYYFADQSAADHKGVLELADARVREAVLAERDDDGEAFQICVSLRQTGKEVWLAAGSAEQRREWVVALSAATGLPPADAPLRGVRDKRIAQLSAEKQQVRLMRAVSEERTASRTLNQQSPAERERSMQLLLAAQTGRDWRGFSQSDADAILRVGGMVVQRFGREETLMRLGEAATFFAIVLEGTVAVRLGESVAGLKYPGDLLGEMALFNGGLRSADLMTTSDGYVATMSFHQLEKFKQSPVPAEREVAERLNALLAQRTLEKNLELSRKAPGSVDQKAELEELYRKQKGQNWTSPHRAAEVELDMLYRQTEDIKGAPAGAEPEAPRQLEPKPEAPRQLEPNRRPRVSWSRSVPLASQHGGPIYILEDGTFSCHPIWS